MTLAWDPELADRRAAFCAEFEHRCLSCGEPVARRGISPDVAMAVACKYFDVTIDDLRSNCRHNDLVEARALVAWALRSLGRPRSYRQIGAELNRDQSSINHLHHKAIELRLRNEDFDKVCRGIGERWMQAGENRHVRCS